MSESLREHRPLLCEEFSDEELHPSHYCPQQRFQHSFRGRARSKVKGAAAIISRWPDDWSSSVLFWWIAVGMFLLLMMVIYNTIVALVLIPPTLSLPFTTEANNKVQVTRPDVNMHVMIDADEIVDLKHYLPFINKLTDKYENFNYNFIVLLNDSSTAATNKILEENNDNAMNDVLFENLNTRRERSEVGALNVQHVFLSEYLNNSPLRNRWRQIPAQFIPFLVRAVSVWENGGIAIDPLILTPLTPNLIYSNKLQEVMQKLGRTEQIHDKIIENNELKNNYHHVIPKKKANNIQEIIHDYDSNDFDDPKHEFNLSEAEDQEIEVTTGEKSFQRSKKSTINEVKGAQDLHKKKITSESVNNASEKDDIENKEHIDSTVLVARKDIEVIKSPKGENSYRPMIVLPNDDGRKVIKIDNSASANNNDEIFTIDLNGNFLASKARCHAFVGYVFNDVVHQSNFKSVSDFIIQELSKFCNGILTSCKGIDVILV